MKKYLLLLLAVLLIPFALFAQAYSLGDVNHSSSIDIVDALLVAQYYVGLNPSGYNAAQADVNASGSVDIVDALLIAQYYVGLITQFPGQTQTTAPTSAPTAAPAQYTLTITVSGNGTTNPGVGTGTYASGTSVSVSAQPASGATFTGWSGAATGTSNPVTIVMNGNKSLTATFSGGGGQTSNSIIGYATQNGGTTGGKGGTTVNVSTGTAFQDAIDNKGSGGLIIMISGTITPSNSGSLEKIDVKDVSNISIFNGEMNGIGIKVWRATNVIIRNVKIHHVNIGDKDAIGVQESTNVWIDHNEVYSDTANGKDYYDGAIDISHACDFVTVSFNYVHDHYKTSLVGHSDSNASEDTGKLHVTYFGNWFNNVSARTPLLRFGTVHIFNNYMSNYFDASTGCNIRMGAVTRIEGNVFVNVANPILSVDSDSIGYWDLGPGSADTNTYSGATWATGSPASSSQTNASLNGFQDTCSYTPPYSYTLMAASQVAAYVQANAGVGKVNPAN